MKRLELEELSQLGFGGYRVSVGNGEQEAALEEALRAGCNLVDTASNYEDGRSEELVGVVLSRTAIPAFVITKLGYVSPSAAARLEQAGVKPDAIAHTDDGSLFTLDPDALAILLRLSRKRLRRSVLDAVLLHNPERLLRAGADLDDLRAGVKAALAFLAHEVEAGRLRFYGISSNLLPSVEPEHPLDLDAIVEVVPAATPPALIQFPLNLLERAAATDAQRPALVKRAAAMGICSVANRPLNALVNGRLVRLALANGRSADAPADSWERCTDVVSARLSERGEAEPWASFRPMQFLRDNRDGIPDPGLIDAIWNAQIDPFLTALFDGEPTADAAEAFRRLREEMVQAANITLANDTRRALRELEAERLLEPMPDHEVALAACRYCLEAGADHVLVGMRRRAYVESLRPLLAHTSSLTPR
jgi:aryl-alcohol dehydrogenase-like predicted oxidoreductase